MRPPSSGASARHPGEFRRHPPRRRRSGAVRDPGGVPARARNLKQPCRGGERCPCGVCISACSPLAGWLAKCVCARACKCVSLCVCMLRACVCVCVHVLPPLSLRLSLALSLSLSFSLSLSLCFSLCFSVSVTPGGNSAGQRLASRARRARCDTALPESTARGRMPERRVPVRRTEAEGRSPLLGKPRRPRQHRAARRAAADLVSLTDRNSKAGRGR